ncbi:hypothetical protein CANMA_000465 [Candida margitis]|uniref:uncharacterized protein n=1 Tax=Candida margitis TaxID=1775924 RepID=UPI0022270F7E|nr:uncharacterized protein CANMA_000465 [Candida margitis]KAI5970556.1 hypothetical protein CANMA_000465 [Candida margitis]
MSTSKTTSGLASAPAPSSTTKSSSSRNKSHTNIANPVLTRYLTTPIVFTPAKYQENYSSASQLPASYIVLSRHSQKRSDSEGMKRNGNVNGSTNASQIETGRDRKVGPNRPKSLAEAVASYSGSKYEGPKEKKRKRKLAEMEKRETERETRLVSNDSDGGEENGEDLDTEDAEQPPVKKPKGLWGSLRSLFGGAIPGSEVEDVGEEFIEGDEDKSAPFNLLKRKQTFDNEESTSPSTSADEVYDENSPFTGFSEPEKSENDQNGEDDDDDNEKDDPDFGEEQKVEVSDGPSESDDDEDSDSDDERVGSYEEENVIEKKVSSTESTPSLESEDAGDGEYLDEDANVDKLRHDLKVDQLVNGQGQVYTITRRNLDGSNKINNDDEEEPEEEKLKITKSSSTPPTSPEDSDEQKSLIQRQYYAFNELASDRGSNGSKRIYKNWRELANAKPPVGLLNHGVTCYMNSAIQSLIHIPAFQHYLNDINQGKAAILKPRSISHVLAELSKRMWNPNKPTAKYINPKKIIQRLDDINCMMSEWQQEDSHEYYMSLMSRLQEDSVPKGHKLNESIIYDIFGGLLHQKITCHQCHNISSTKQEFYDLSLGLNKKKYQNSCRFTIEKSINDFFSDEVIRKNDQDSKSGYYCDKCQSFTQANKISSILTAPETLTIHLKRFKFNGNSSSKVKQGICYSKYLDLTKYMDANETTKSFPPTAAKYQLIAVIVHEGRSISSGHYICHVLQPDGVSWSTYDDEYINRIDEKKALSDANAYVLVYTKLTPK